MKKDYLYEALLAEIRKKIPQNSKLVSKLVDILSIEKEAVYRRLRCEVPFTFHEIIIISKELGLSLDNIVGIDTEKRIPFQLQLIEFLDPLEIDYLMMEEYANIYKYAKLENNTEKATLSCTLPQALYSGYSNLIRFYLFKRYYHYENNTPSKTFQDIPISTRLLDFFKNNFIETKNISITYYILDSQTFQYLVNDIKYFNSIRLISDNDILNIKEELFQLIDYIEKLTINGYYEETGNKVNFYISDIHIETNYTYIEVSNLKISLIWTFLLDCATSLDEKTFNVMKTWLKSVTRTSTLISVSGEKSRTLYFERQRKIINDL